MVFLPLPPLPLPTPYSATEVRMREEMERAPYEARFLYSILFFLCDIVGQRC